MIDCEACDSATEYEEWSLSAADWLSAWMLAMCLVTFTVLPKLNFRRPRASRPGSSSADSVSSSRMSMLMTDVLSGVSDASGVQGLSCGGARHWVTLMACAAPESATDHAEWSFRAADWLW